MAMAARSTSTASTKEEIFGEQTLTTSAGSRRKQKITITATWQTEFDNSNFNGKLCFPKRPAAGYDSNNMTEGPALSPIHLLGASIGRDHPRHGLRQAYDSFVNGQHTTKGGVRTRRGSCCTAIARTVRSSTTGLILQTSTIDHRSHLDQIPTHFRKPDEDKYDSKEVRASGNVSRRVNNFVADLLTNTPSTTTCTTCRDGADSQKERESSRTKEAWGDPLGGHPEESLKRPKMA